MTARLDLECAPASTVDAVTYAIAEAAHRSGLSIDTLRYYERIELIDPPARDSGGRRAYSEEDLAWLGFLTKLRTTGMPIRMMREYARLRHQGSATFGRRKQILVEQRTEVLERIAELQRLPGRAQLQDRQLRAVRAGPRREGSDRGVGVTPARGSASWRSPRRGSAAWA